VHQQTLALFAYHVVASPTHWVNSVHSEGYEDGTGHVCELIKTIYGLKQSGCKWNHEFNAKLKNLSYTQLYLDPCTYIQCKGNNISIITVWVDDLQQVMTSCTK